MLEKSFIPLRLFQSLSRTMKGLRCYSICKCTSDPVSFIDVGKSHRTGLLGQRLGPLLLTAQKAPGFLAPPVLWQCRVVRLKLVSGFVSQWGTSVSETLIFFNELQRNLPSHFPEGRHYVWYPDKETHLLSTWRETLSLSSKVVYCMNILVKVFWTKSWYKMSRKGRDTQEITAAVFFYVKVLVLRTLGNTYMTFQCKRKCVF